MIKTVGFIGLGVMGHNMALNLAQKMPAGVKLIIFDVDKAKTEALVKAAETRGAAAAGASSITDLGSTDLIFLSLPNSSIVQNVITGLSPILKSGSIIADTSTTEVSVVKVLASELEKIGIDFADTPVSGGEKAAIDGTLSFMAGAKEGVFAEIKPFCSTMAASVVHMGGVGSGQTAKAVNQMIVGAAFAVIAESFSLGARSGLDPKILYEAIKGGWAGSKVLDVAAKDMFSRDFKPGGTVDIHWKDLGYALNLSKDTDTPVPVTALVHEIFKASRAHGDGKNSQPAIVKLWESLLNQEVK